MVPKIDTLAVPAALPACYCHKQPSQGARTLQQGLAPAAPPWGAWADARVPPAVPSSAPLRMV